MQNCPVYGAIIIINNEEIFINNEEKIYKNIFEQAHMKKQCMRIHLKLVTLNVAQRLKEIYNCTLNCWQKEKPMASSDSQ